MEGGKGCTVYLDEGNLRWLEDQVREGKFSSISDGIRKCVAEARELEGVMKVKVRK